MTPNNLSRRLTWALDFLALVALLATSEVRLEVFGLVAVMFAASRILPFRFNDHLMLFLLNLVVFGALGAYFKFHIHPIISAAYAAPFVHSLVWFMEDNIRNRSWRMAVGFIELILASSLTAEVYLFPTIFAFVVFGAVQVSCSFLHAELGQRAPRQVKEPLPAGFVGKSLGLAFMIFLSSVVIFPLLPRVNVGSGYGAQVQTGYTENVNLNENLKLSGGERGAQPVLWFYPRGDADLLTSVYLGLIRGRVLDIFDGENWFASPKHTLHQDLPELDDKSMSAMMKDAVVVDAVRSTLSSEVLPVPYGAVRTYTGPEDHPIEFPRLKSGEWIDPNSNQERLHYSFAFIPYRAHIYEPSNVTFADVDPPLPPDTVVPRALQTERIERLRHRLFDQANDPTEKVDRLRDFFSRERFTAVTSDNGSAETSNLGAAKRLHPLERFLFINKEGNCEWFASSSAVLLRMAGIPARLVAGFRLTSSPLGGVLTVSSADAHAWVEYWHPAKGWTPFDPTPRMIRPPSFFRFFRSSYDWVSGYWYRMILGYQGASEKKSVEKTISETWVATGINPSLNRWKTQIADAFRDYWEQIMAFIAIVLGGAFFIYLFYQSYSVPGTGSLGGSRKHIKKVLRERMKMEKLLSVKLRKRRIFSRIPPVDYADALLVLESRDDPALEALREWKGSYESLRYGRFGATADLSDCAERLNEKYRAVKKLLIAA